MDVGSTERLAGQRRAAAIFALLCGTLIAAATTVCQAAPPGLVPGAPTPVTGNVGVAPPSPDSGATPPADNNVGKTQSGEVIPPITPRNITSWSNTTSSNSGHATYKCTDGKATSFQDTPCGKTAVDQNHDKSAAAKPVY